MGDFLVPTTAPSSPRPSARGPGLCCPPPSVQLSALLKPGYKYLCPGAAGVRVTCVYHTGQATRDGPSLSAVSSQDPVISPWGEGRGDTVRHRARTAGTRGGCLGDLALAGLGPSSCHCHTGPGTVGWGQLVCRTHRCSPAVLPSPSCLLSSMPVPPDIFLALLRSCVGEGTGSLSFPAVS